MPNQYNDENFFVEYAGMDRSRFGLSEAGEWPQMQKLLGNLANASVLDLGCGYGWHARYAMEQGAAKVLGVDSSEKMLKQAASMTNDRRIEYRCLEIEDFVPDENAYDIVISNLALHYIADIEKVYGKIYRALKPGGCFVMNIEHPVFTAGANQSFMNTPDGAKVWPVDDYFIEGSRQTDFLGHTVFKQHHTLTTILMGLISRGFVLQVVEEVCPDRETVEAKGWQDEWKRPMMLLVKAVK